MRHPSDTAGHRGGATTGWLFLRADGDMGLIEPSGVFQCRPSGAEDLSRGALPISWFDLLQVYARWDATDEAEGPPTEVNEAVGFTGWDVEGIPFSERPPLVSVPGRPPPLHDEDLMLPRMDVRCFRRALRRFHLDHPHIEVRPPYQPPQPPLGFNIPVADEPQSDIPSVRS